MTKVSCEPLADSPEPDPCDRSRFRRDRLRESARRIAAAAAVFVGFRVLLHVLQQAAPSILPRASLAVRASAYNLLAAALLVASVGAIVWVFRRGRGRQPGGISAARAADASVAIIAYGDGFLGFIALSASLGHAPRAVDLPGNMALYWFVQVIACAVAGVGEEQIFRRYLLQEFERLGASFLIAAVVSSLLFAAAHPNADMASSVFRFVFGMIFCVGLRVTGSIWFGAGIHFVHDLLLSAFTSGVVDGASNSAHTGTAAFKAVVALSVFTSVLFALSLLLRALLILCLRTIPAGRRGWASSRAA